MFLVGGIRYIVASRRRRVVAGTLAVVLTLGLLQAVQEPVAAAPAPTVPSQPQQDKRAPNVPAKPAKARPVDPASVRALKSAPKVSWPAAGTTAVTLTGNGAAASGVRPRGAVKAATLPVWVAPSPVQAAAVPSAAAPKSVRVQMLDQPAAQRAGVAGVVLKLVRTDGNADAGTVSVSLDYSAFRYAYGGDWAARLRLVEIPDCALTTPNVPQCRQRTVLPTKNDTKAGVLSAPARALPAGVLLAAEAAAGGTTGDYKASTLSPSGKWDVSVQSGDFSWSYPLGAPPVPGGLAPQFGLSYSSNAVDGHVAASNNQPSWVGDGWSLTAGSIVRQYKSCATDDIPEAQRTGDECWGGDNATLTLGGKSTQLVRVDDATWRPASDDGSRIQKIFDTSKNDPSSEDPGDDNGEYWKVTKPDGTQYFFGMNHLPGWSSGKASTKSTWTAPVFGRNSGEPCHQATFAASWCRQAYQWNLDYVVDPFGNAISYFYQPETNNYGLNLTKSTVKYTRGGYLLRAEYGTRAGSTLDGQAPVVVTFATADRCVPGKDCTKHDTASWPDVPWDQECVASTCPTHASPTFWSTKRLGRITTQIRGSGGPACVDQLSGYRCVDLWAMDQTYVDPGDGSGIYLWLKGIVHTGLDAGTAAMPEVTFAGTPYPNRVNSVSDGPPPMDKFRISAIYNESGGKISVDYAGIDCDPAALPTPDSNNTRCFPFRWSPEKSGPIDDWFTRYVVKTVIQHDGVGGAADQTTTYVYPARGAAWAYNDNPLIEAKHWTWSDWRGYQNVTVLQGDPVQRDGPQSQTDYLYFRGINGDHLSNGGTRPASVTDSQQVSLTDDPALAGFPRETIVRNGKDGPVLTSTITEASVRGPTATQGSLKAYMVNTKLATVRTQVPNGTWRTTQVATSYDNNGNPTSIEDRGDTSTSADDQCTTTKYATNTDAWILAAPSESHTVSNSCANPDMTPTNLVTALRSAYDNQDFDKPPTRGKATNSQLVTSFDGTNPQYTQEGRLEYDGLGRTTSTFDALDRKVVTAYTDTNGLTTGVTTTNVKSFVTRSFVDPARGLAVSNVDAGGYRTDLSYDPLGRLAAVWKPGRSQASDTPDVRYTYQMRSDVPSYVKTDRLVANGNTVVTYDLLDGFLRNRQTQAPTYDGGIAVVDKFYNSRGLVSKTNDTLAIAGTAGPTLLLANDGQVPAQSRIKFDGAGRATVSEVWSRDVMQSSTTTDYFGDHTDVTPPAGGTASSTYTDTRGQPVELRQYHGATPSGPYDSTRYTYYPSGKQATLKDPAGNVTQFWYNLRGDETKQTDPDSGITQYAYDNGGQLLSSTDPRGQLLSFTYDELGRKTGMYEGAVSDDKQLLGWGYDALVRGALDSSTRYVGKDAYVSATTKIDAAGRSTEGTLTIPDTEGKLAGTYVTGTGYLADGSPSFQDMPELGDLTAEHVDYTYNSFGLLSTMTGKGNYVTDTVYSAYFEMSQIRFGSTTGTSVWQTNTYDDTTGHLTKSVLERNGVGGVVVKNSDYAYDAAGNITSVDDRSGGSTLHDVQCYSYDYKRQLTQAWAQSSACAAAPSTAVLGGPSPYWQSFTYDNTGNRKSKTDHAVGSAATTVTTSTYPAPAAAHPHAIKTTAVGTAAAQSYEYDDAGDTTSRPSPNGTQTLEWNSEQQLASVKVAGATSHYVYDNDGNLLISHDASGDTLHLATGEVHVDPAGKKTGTRYYSYGSGQFAVRTIAGLQYEFSDAQGTNTVAVNAANVQQSTQRRFEPFGESRDSALVSWPDSRGFAGGVQSSATGLTRMGIRDYDPNTGRFLSVDPVLNPAQPKQNNGYAYAWNNPTTMSDPSGADPIFHECMDASADRAQCMNYYYYGNPAPINTAWADNHCHWNARCIYDSPNGGKGSGYTRDKEKFFHVSHENHCGWAAFLCNVLPINSIWNCVSETTNANCSQAFLDTVSTLLVAPKAVKGLLALKEWLGGLRGAEAASVAERAAAGSAELAEAEAKAAPTAAAKAAEPAAGSANAAEHAAETAAAGGPKAAVPAGPVNAGGGPVAAVPKYVYRGGAKSPSNFKVAEGEAPSFSFRDSLSNPVPMEGRPVMQDGKQYVAIDTSKMPPGSVVPDGAVGSTVTPPGHVSVNAPYETIQGAMVTPPPGGLANKFPKEFPPDW